MSKKAKLMKKVTKNIVNQADRDIVNVEIVRIIPEDGTVVCNIYNSSGDIKRNRVYSYNGEYKNIISDDLTADEIAYLEGDAPTDQWDIKLVQQYMDDRQTPNEEEIVSPDDPYHYTQDMTVTELLAKIEAVQVGIMG